MGCRYQNFSSIIIEIPEKIKTTIIDVKALPGNWKETEQKKYTQQIGDGWYNKQETLLLQVPSAIISREVNSLSIQNILTLVKYTFLKLIALCLIKELKAKPQTPKGAYLNL